MVTTTNTMDDDFGKKIYSWYKPLDYLIEASSSLIDHPCAHMYGGRDKARKATIATIKNKKSISKTADGTRVGREGIKAMYWGSQSPEGKLNIKLDDVCLVSEIKLKNRGCKNISVYAAMEDTPLKRKYLKIAQVERLPYGKETTIDMGHIPCRYLRIVISGGCPISIHHLAIMGVSCTKIKKYLNPSLKNVMYRIPRDILFGNSLNLSIQHPLHMLEKLKEEEFNDEDNERRWTNSLEESHNPSSRQKSGRSNNVKFNHERYVI